VLFKINFLRLSKDKGSFVIVVTVAKLHLFSGLSLFVLKMFFLCLLQGTKEVNPEKYEVLQLQLPKKYILQLLSTISSPMFISLKTVICVISVSRLGKIIILFNFC